MLEQSSFEPLRLSAEKILSASLGDRICINRVQSLMEEGRRNLLLRCWIDSVEAIPSSFMVKKVEAENYNLDSMVKMF